MDNKSNTILKLDQGNRRLLAWLRDHFAMTNSQLVTLMARQAVKGAGGDVEQIRAEPTRDHLLEEIERLKGELAKAGAGK